MTPKRIVIWGLRKKYHTHRHIHQAFYKNALKLGFETIWLEDEKKNRDLIRPGDLIITADIVGKMVPEKFELKEYHLPIRDDIFYCLHNVKDIFVRELNRKNYINLKVYNNSLQETKSIERWGSATFFDKEKNTLYQPWGTDLLPHEFKKPTYTRIPIVFWIGSIWNDTNNHGNIKAIAELKESLKRRKIGFIHLRFIPDALNVFFIRMSRIAPAIAGAFQVKTGYLPCRMFKNISYGQLGITNIKEFKEILGDSFIEGNTIEDLVNNALSFSKEQCIDKIKAQQNRIKEYTYETALTNILRALERTHTC